ncbi:MAG TPA: hypothetical protein VG937_27810 [Polyangiaceae bacterium]|jgi:hypothetical protein|nr:hypothetical protein [Polyangiaceae bacterium]
MATQGAEAFEKQDYETALDRFQRASSLFRAPSISVMEARTLVKLGRLVAALDKYEETRHTALPPDASEALQRAVNDAARESEELRARIPLLRISLVGKPLSGEAKVTIDGKPVPPALLDVERPVDPGHHAIEATATGLLPVRRSIELVQGEHRQIEIQFGSNTPQDRLLLTPQTEQRVTPPAADSTPRNSLETWGWAATGLGAVGLGTSLVTGMVALGKKSDLDSACHPGCPQSSSDTLDSFRFNRTLSYASFVVGAAGLGVGGYILLSGSRESNHVSASLSPAGAALSGAF